MAEAPDRDGAGVNSVEFSVEPRLWGVAAKPYRAHNALPEWWKKMPRNLPTDGFPAHTIKACVPVTDMLTTGYILPLPFDLHVRSRKGERPLFSWRFAPEEFISEHGIEQVPIYGGAWKMSNPWLIKTSPGTSCLFLHPTHRPELPFHTLEAVVDTDTYTNHVNLPFLWPDQDYDGVLRAGTPWAQVIPFAREPWTMSVHAMTDKGVAEVDRTRDRVQANSHAYRRFHHQPKTYQEA